MMGSSLGCLQELEQLSHNKSRETQQSFLKRIIDLFFITQALQGREENQLFGRVIMQIIGHVDFDSRRELAQKLAKAPKAPREVINHLASDHIDIAAPVLKYSAVLSDHVLLNIIENDIPSHSSMICQRENLSEVVTDVLLDRCFDDAVICLINNNKATISPSGFDKLIDFASKHQDIRSALLNRANKPEDCYDRIKETIAYSLRKGMLDKYPDLSESKADDLAFARADKILNMDQVSLQHNSKKAVGADGVRALFEEEELTQYVIADLARNHQEQLTIQALALVSGFNEKTVSHIVFTAEISALSVFCKNIQFSRDSFLAILELKALKRQMTDMVVDLALKRYDELTLENAARIMDYLDERFKNMV